MPRLLLILVAAFAWLLPAPISASQTRMPVELEWLMGKWEGGGTHSGRESKASLEAGYALGSTVVELRYVMTLRVKFFPKFEGRAFYRPLPDRRLEGQWFDSFGDELPFPRLWKGPHSPPTGGRQGPTEAAPSTGSCRMGRLEIVDSVLRADGKHSEFARQTFARANH